MEASACNSNGVGEMTRDVREAMGQAQESVRHAVGLVQAQLSQLQEEHSLLQSRYSALESQHEALQLRYGTESHSWRQFKVWWKSTLERKRNAQAQGTPGKASDRTDIAPLTSSPLVAPATFTTSERKRKARVTESELDMLERVGLDCSDLFQAKGKRGSETRGGARVKLEERGNEEEERDREQAHKKHCSSIAVKREPVSSTDSPPRLPLEEVGNRPGVLAGRESDEREGRKKERQGKLESLQRDPSKHKGRGRYSTGSTSHGSKTINGEFEVDQARNGNLAFLHKDVVRDQAARRQMHAFDCECCSEYYKAVGEAPLRRHQDPRTIENSSGGEKGEGKEKGERARQLHRQQISRHRDYGPPASTPPGYWDVGFPTTQKQQEVNRLAREGYERKRDELTRDPRFKRRS